jgi:hypothetical protein
MRDFVDLGVTTPSEETCAQLGSTEYDYYDRARREARALINQIRRLFGPEPPGASLSLKSNPHDFGTYVTVVCFYNGEDQVSAEYAERCDRQCPKEWDDEARTELSVTQ